MVLYNMGSEFLFEGPWDKFYVKENGKLVEIISVMMERVVYWDKFPAVDLVLSGGIYYVFNDGNHTSLAHYFLDAPLRCNLVAEDEGASFWKKKYFQISEVRLASLGEDGADDDAGRIKEALGYFPRDAAEDFCLKNNLDARYLSQ